MDDKAARKRLEKLSKMVILRHMFRKEDIARDVSLMAEIKADLLDECEKIGTVTKIDLYDLSDDGVCSIRFTEIESAMACVALMNGRYFDGLRIEAIQAHLLPDPTEIGRLKRLKSDYKATAATEEEDKGNDNEEDQRLDDFGAWLESQ